MTLRPEKYEKIGRRARAHVRRRIRELFVALDRACYYCGELLSIETATIDHKIPLSHGGTDHSENLLLACEPCNTARQTLSVASFARLMKLAKAAGRVAEMQTIAFARRADALGYLPEQEAR